ncbi:EF-P lysine aminoacylase EpmA [Anianabacter salinae]|uniref:EF-P lysine aminoacylase EpmA n=1 Tax=Anianabacter salinae TaxID=2851023 RepID=UPI00225E68A0|nr:EF-P lysine aminoacylase EpmA [Anianabacter salinae]MBV0914076.1 EF-P lysine aminoacylase GenX [Anianabacter salinae]
MTDTSPWWDPARHNDRRPFLMARNVVRRALQDWFDAQGFTEVAPAALSLSPGNEAHLHGFQTTLLHPDGRSAPRYLHTSPEFAMKKLLAAGETRIHAFAHVWRNREAGPLHSPEFTMLEWYRADAPYDAVIDDTVALIAAAAAALGARSLQYRDRRCDPAAPPERLTVADAFARHAGIDLLATCHADGTTDRAALAAECAANGIATAPDDTWSDIVSKVLTGHVEPHLGQGRITILDRYPAAEAALARRTPDDPRTAERFEVYACGVELANGFGELTDAAEQRRRFEAEMDEKQRVYGHRYPLDEEFLAALAHMPEASGVAMGFDRLVMLASGAPTIDHVLWTPISRL